MKQENFHVQCGTWSALGEQASAIRFAVFVEEQQVPIAEELDERDEFCLHALAFDPTGAAVATGRLLPDGHIGRMAVLRAERNKGAGAAVLKSLMNAARSQGLTEVMLGAQLHAKGFYLKQGFIPFGSVFLDANIEHVMMKKQLRTVSI